MSVKSEIDTLTGLRFLAAFSVAVAHGTIVTLRADPGLQTAVDLISRGAAFGMTLFFVLSGFVIHYNYRHSVTWDGFNGFGSFIWARFARLYPLFFLILVLDFLTHARESYDPFRLETQIRALPYYLAMVQSWIYYPIRDHSLIYTIGLAVPVTWSISTEWFFYLVFPAIAPLVLYLRNARAAIIVAILWCAFWWIVMTALNANVGTLEDWAVAKYGPIASAASSSQDSFSRWLLYFSPYARIGEFILGCIIAQLYILLQGQVVRPHERRVGVVLQAVAFIVSICVIQLMYSGANAPTFLSNVKYNIAPAPAIAVLIFCSARYAGSLSNFLSSRAMVKLGDVSYEIYLIHFPVFVFIQRLSQSTFGQTQSAELRFMNFFVSLAAIACGSVLLHSLYEIPTRRWLRGLWQKAPKKVVAGFSGRKLAGLILTLPVLAAIVLAGMVKLHLPALSPKGGISVAAVVDIRSCDGASDDLALRVTKACGGLESCSFDLQPFGARDESQQCRSEYKVDYQCDADPDVWTVSSQRESSGGDVLNISCAGKAESRRRDRPADGGIKIVIATYGASCHVPAGNVTNDIAEQCSGNARCAYRVNVTKLRDPAPGCAKDYSVDYTCGGNAERFRSYVKGEAGLGSYAILDCSAAAKKR